MAKERVTEKIGPAIVLTGAAVVAMPLFRHLGLGSMLGYFAAGLLVSLLALGLIRDLQAILHFSELGVVMILFLIGQELRSHAVSRPLCMSGFARLRR